MATNPAAVLDHHAQQLGFPNYATWAAWNAQKSASLRNSHTVVGDGTNAAPPVNHMQNAAPQAAPSSGFMGYILNRWNQATGGK